MEPRVSGAGDSGYGAMNRDQREARGHHQRQRQRERTDHSKRRPNPTIDTPRTRTRSSRTDHQLIDNTPEATDDTNTETGPAAATRRATTRTDPEGTRINDDRRRPVETRPTTRKRHGDLDQRPASRMDQHQRQRGTIETTRHPTTNSGGGATPGGKGQITMRECGVGARSTTSRVAVAM